MLEVTIDTSQYKALEAKFPQIVDQAAYETAAFGLEEIVRSTPVKTGAARASWTLLKQNNSYTISSSLGRGASYTPWLEYGTKPHIIGPKSPPGTMAFKVGGQTLFRRYPTKKGQKGMMHPGSSIWKGRIVKENLTRIADYFDTAIKRVIKKVLGA